MKHLIVGILSYLLFVESAISHESESLSKLVSHFNQEIVDKTLVGFLKFLPPTLKTNPVFIYKSSSLQGASFEFPRSLISNAEGSLVLAFNGHPTFEGYGKIEAMEFSEKEAKFRFYELSFSAEKGMLLSPENPSKCLSCHRSDPRPNWESYDQWPGSYGSQDDRLAEKEIAPFKRFLETAPLDERYNTLRLSPLLPVLNFTSHFGRLPEEPNITFTKKLSRLNFKRVARLIVDSKDYASYRYLIAATLGCSSQMQSNEILPKEYLPIFSYFSESQIQEAKQIKTSIGAEYTHPSTLRLRSLFDSRGLDTSDWFMNFKGGLNNSFLNGIPWEAQLVEALLERDPELKLFLLENSTYQLDCSRLSDKSFEILSKRQVGESFKTFESNPKSAEQIWNRSCVQCHAVQPLLKMTFAEAVSKKFFHALIEEGAMPKDQTLTPSEKKALQQFK